MPTAQTIEGALKVIHCGRLLDLATGGGWFIGWMQTALDGVQSAFGIDARPQPVAEPGSVFASGAARYLQMDAHHLAFADASFDTVTISFALHHMADPQAVLAEAVRLLRPGGHCIFYEMFQDGDQTETQRTHILMHHWWAGIDRELGSIHNETFRRGDLVALAEGLDLSAWQFFDRIETDPDPHSPGRIQRLRGRLSDYLKRARDLPDYELLLSQAADYQRRLDTIGIASATNLLAIGRK